MVGKIGNITFDAHDPVSLANFWSDVLGYPRSQLPPGLRQQLLDNGLTEKDMNARWVAEDPTGDGQRLFFQKVPEKKRVKNRVHLDISATPGRRPSRDEVDAEKDRIVALGASVVHRVDLSWGGFAEYHWVMHDPEGNEFCIQ